jgi:SAM-dependent methyltransferase
MFGMILCRVIMAGVRLGVYEELARGRATATDLAERRGLSMEGARHLLDSLCAAGHVTRRGGHYAITARARRWLDPASDTYIGGFLEFNYDQWEWWSRLEEVVRTGTGFDIHGYGPEDPRWERYITAMFQLARLSAPEVAAKLRLPPSPSRVIDLAGAHGWFAAELCRRHAGMTGVVMDLPGSAAVGRRLLTQAGMADRVQHVEGDILADPLGGPYDAALCFQIIHHLAPEQNHALFRRVREALGPGGTLAVLDYFAPPPRRKPDTAAFLGLHFFLTSSAATYSVEEVTGWMKAAGFRSVRRVPLRRVPIQVMLEGRV